MSAPTSHCHLRHPPLRHHSRHRRPSGPTWTRLPSKGARTRPHQMTLGMSQTLALPLRLLFWHLTHTTSTATSFLTLNPRSNSILRLPSSPPWWLLIDFWSWQHFSSSITTVYDNDKFHGVFHEKLQSTRYPIYGWPDFVWSSTDFSIDLCLSEKLSLFFQWC